MGRHDAQGSEPLAQSTSDFSGRALRFWLGAGVLLLPFRFEVGGLNLAPADLALAMSFLFGFAAIRLYTAVLRPWVWMLVVLSAVSLLLRAIWGETPSSFAVANRFGGILTMLAWYVVVGTVVHRRPSEAERLLRLFLGSVAAVILATAVDLYTAIDVPLVEVFGGKRRPAGTFIDPNAFGGLLAFALAFLIARLLDEGRRSRFAFVSHSFVLLLGVALLIATESRSAWIGMAAALLALFVLEFRRMTVASFVLAVVIGGVGSMLGLGVVAESQERIDVALERSFTIEDRVLQLEGAVEAFQSNPVLGTGLGSIFDETGAIVHNTAAWFLGELGLIGLGILAWVAFDVVRRLDALSRLRRSTGRRPWWALGSIAALAAAAGFSLGVEALYQRHIWMVIGIALALGGKAEGSATVSLREQSGSGVDSDA